MHSTNDQNRRDWMELKCNETWDNVNNSLKTLIVGATKYKIF